VEGQSNVEETTRYSAQFKFQLALKATKGLKTINELASEHGVHPNQVSEWKRQLLDRGDTIFSREGARRYTPPNPSRSAVCLCTIVSRLWHGVKGYLHGRGKHRPYC
jgi:transposase-like protein